MPETLNVSELIGQDGSFTPAFHEKIPQVLGEGFEGYKTDKIKDLSSLVKSYATLEKAQGKKIEDVVKGQGYIRLPGQDAKPEDIQAFNKAVGVPDNADGYEFTRPKLPEGMTYDEAYEKAAKGFFHQIGMPKAMAAKVADWFNTQQAQRYEAMAQSVEAARAKAEETLKADPEWAGDKYQANMNILTQFVEHIFPKDVRDALAAEGVDLMAIPGIRKSLVAAAKKILPDTTPGSSGNAGGGAKKSIYNHPTSKELK